MQIKLDMISDHAQLVGAVTARAYVREIEGWSCVGRIEIGVQDNWGTVCSFVPTDTGRARGLDVVNGTELELVKMLVAMDI